MQERKALVTGDYIDTSTEIRFLEDVRGNLRALCPMFSGGSGHHEEVTNNYETVNNYYSTTNNNTEVVVGFDYSNAQLIVLQTRIKDFTWANTTAFHKINNSFGGGFLTYTVPFGKKFHIKSLICSQHRGSSDEISYLGIFKGLNLLMSIPFTKDVNLSFDFPIIFDTADFIELKFWPYHKNTDLGVMLKGYTL